MRFVCLPPGGHQKEVRGGQKKEGKTFTVERFIPEWRRRRAEAGGAGEPAGRDVEADPGSYVPRLPSHNMFPGVFYALLAGFLGAVASSTAKLSLGADYLKGVCETGLRTWGEQRKFRQADETTACDRVRAPSEAASIIQRESE